ncbi:MAG: sensor histidine kinase [Steroidobacteraceae bacterium]
MKSVYGRIFLTVSIASLLMLGLGTAVSFLMVSERIERLAGHDAAHVAAAAAAAIDRGGEAALRDWLRAEEARQSDMQALVVDNTGADMLGRPVPAGLATRTPAVLKPDPADGSRSLYASRWIPQVQLADGRRFAVYLVERNPSWWDRVGIKQLPLLLIALAILVSGAVAGILARSFSRPIRELARATRSFAAGLAAPEVSGRVVARNDELGALARDFTAMAGRLEHLLKARDRLVRDMSHELRTPLARLNVALELLRRRDPDNRLEGDVARLQQQIDRLDHMIGSILNLSRLDAMSAPPRFQPIDLAPFVEEVVEDARLEAAQRHCVLGLVDAEGVEAQVYGSPMILGSALQNVLRNAIHHTSEGTRVDIRLRAGGGEANIVVQDHGPGVPTDALEHIFEPFFRVDDAGNRHPGGSGLGLAIVARAMRLHRGSAKARNLPAGGLEITLTLPTMAAGAAPVEPDYFGEATSRLTS